MNVIQLKDINITFGDRLLFEVDHLTIHQGERIGLVGKNGSGKSTLLQVIDTKGKGITGSIEVNGTCVLLPQLKEQIGHLSGGELTQKIINEGFEKKPDIFLADEPTSHLDLAFVNKIEQQWKRFRGTLVVVSHDREFLDRMCTKIWAIEENKIREYKGNYSEYLAQKELEERKKEAAYEEFVKKTKQLEAAIVEKERRAERATKAPVGQNVPGILKPYYANKQKKLRKTVKAMESRLEQLDVVDQPRKKIPIKMMLPDADTLKGKTVLSVEQLSTTVGTRMLWENISFRIQAGDHVALLGNNGSGKTTLFQKVLAKERGVSVSPNVKFGYFSQNLDVLNEKKSILVNVKSTAVQAEDTCRTVLARLQFLGEDVFKPVSVLSGGERVKVAFAKLFVSDVNFLLLDEPTNYLDLDAVEAIENLLKEYDGTLVFISHDRRFVQQVAKKIMLLENGHLEFYPDTYDAFLNRRIEAVRNTTAEEVMLIETRMVEVIGKMSIAVTEELENEFQELVAQKRKIVESL
ncbi:ribosomal protection-like ABC-F family protein [Paenisporosarcina cavernae]|uniref:ABC-F type ribosomal protection protein n=1 Tax=Paenisporosarcina cavernae TaxID=2320858 RepID=A0A385YW96_9BACL|nr:ABC-F type ribosomal protection protein [Paenisporosarcina cavernae]AYC30741.1 ABC-F type ribosomal protection protein [Paenisporosarcina cavernae]